MTHWYREIRNLIDKTDALGVININEGFEDLLSPIGQSNMIGDEKGKVNPNGISKFVSPHGSVRYVMCMNDTPVAVLQIVVSAGKAVIANVFTEEKYRRKGLATALFKRAKKDYPNLTHSEDQSDDGKAWSGSLTELARPQEIRDFSAAFNDPQINKRVQAQAARKNPSWKKSLVASMKKHGFEFVGAGINGAVFKNPNYPFVIKVYRTDPGFDEWVYFIMTNKGNKFVPKIQGKPIRLNNIFTAIRIEPLEPCPDDDALAFLDKIDAIMMTSYSAGKEGDDPDMIKIAKFVNNWGPHGDLSPHNLMCRSNGEVVVVDPLYIDPNYKGDW